VIRNLLDEVVRAAAEEKICSYASELFYEGKLAAHPSLAGQIVSDPTSFAGTGLFYVPVVHEGNQNRAPEEAEQVAEIVKGPRRLGVTWTNRLGETMRVSLKDIPDRCAAVQRTVVRNRRAYPWRARRKPWTSSRGRKRPSFSTR